MSFIQDYTVVDWSNFQLAKSGRTIKMLYDKKPLQLCTSTLYSPFGVKRVSKDWSVHDDYFLNCSINQSTSDTSSVFKDFLGKLDDKIMELVNENKEMFAKTDDEIADSKYISILRENGNYPKLLKLQLPRDKNGNFESFFFDDKKSKVKINESNVENELVKGKNFKCIIECNKIWCYNGQIGSIWNIVQCKFSKSNFEPKPQAENVYDDLLIAD